MSRATRRSPRLFVRGRTLLRGCRELLGALGAGAVAVGELCLGWWPQLDGVKADRVKAPKRAKVAPYSIND
jgi:hypothetical protein